jgi:hypothetical protein
LTQDAQEYEETVSPKKIQRAKKDCPLYVGDPRRKMSRDGAEGAARSKNLATVFSS